MDFFKKLDSTQAENNSLLCIGLDPDIAKIPRKLKTKKDPLFSFNKQIIDSTFNLVSAYKPQLAYYSALGADGIYQLKKTIDYIRSGHPKIPVICDAKRADIGKTSEMYAKELFDYLGADAATVNPYLGFDALLPFMTRKDKGVIVLCKTSNPGSADFQDLKIQEEPLFLIVARKVLDMNKKYKNLMMVVGATYPRELKAIRKIAPKMTFLIPGVGAQGGDLEETAKNGLRRDGKGLIISASRSIIYDLNPKSAAQKLRDEINKYRNL